MKNKQLQKIYFATTNSVKFATAQKIAHKYHIKLVQKRIDIPEIQSTSSKKIAEFSAQYVANKYKIPVITTDVSHEIKALKNFPGPFVKYINNWLSASDYLKLMEGHKDRRAILTEIVAYCEPNKKSISFSSTIRATVSKKVNKKASTSISQILILPNFSQPISDIPDEKIIKYWQNNLKGWERVFKYLQSRF